MVGRGKGGGKRREVEEGVGAEALRDTTPVVSTRLPKQPPFGNPRLPRPAKSTCRPFLFEWPKLMKNVPRNQIIDSRLSATDVATTSVTRLF